MKKLFILTGLSLLSFFVQAQSDTVNLPESSSYPGVVRTAYVYEIIIHKETKTATISIKVYHTKDGIKKTKLDGIVYLTATNDIMVNPSTGNYVEKDSNGNYPIGSISEFAYLKSIILSNTINVWALANLYPAKRNEKIIEKLQD